MPSYKREASQRVAYFFGAFIVSAIVGLVVGGVITEVFAGTNSHTRSTVFGYSSFIVFAVICSVAVYKIDQSLNKKYNTNP